jgi:sulfate transport system substrate-binding protein
MTLRTLSRRHLLAFGFAAGLMAASAHASAQTSLLNVSYDPTREFYQEGQDRTGSHD